jgi:16S rRNA (guanine(527)-N(7))-methyltransferase RsmG
LKQSRSGVQPLPAILSGSELEALFRAHWANWGEAGQALPVVLKRQPAGLTDLQWEQVVGFYQCLWAENQVQNLTRLIEPAEFMDYHLRDALEVLDVAGGLAYPALDLGSGGGVPGLLCAILDPASRWILVEAEKRKAAFLSQTVSVLGLANRVQVFSERVEDLLQADSALLGVRTVVSRAVGSVEKVFRWIRKCSTWNILVLLKGPSWEEEWGAFRKSPFKKALRVDSDQHYQVGAERKSRRMVRLARIENP